jgi:hypothetical protein
VVSSAIAISADTLDLLQNYQAIAVADGKPFTCCDDKYNS